VVEVEGHQVHWQPQEREVEGKVQRLVLVVLESLIQAVEAEGDLMEE
jgi:hypothetical protein